jgi:nucleoid-associated protein YgaU
MGAAGLNGPGRQALAAAHAAVALTQTPLLIYTVQAGDTLYSLAQAFLGSSSLWPEIVQASRAIGTHIPRPELIFVGQLLVIPPVPQQGGA